MICERIIEYSNSGRPLYYKCGKPVKYLISYTDTSRSKQVEEHVCGVHRNSLKKWAARVERKYNFKTNFSEKCVS